MMSKKIIPIVTALMLSAQLITMPAVAAIEVNNDNSVNVVNPEVTDTADSTGEDNIDVFADDNVADLLAENTDITKVISDEIAQSPEDNHDIAAKETPAKKPVSKKTARAAGDYTASQKALVSTSADLVTAWNNTAIRYIELQNNITVPNNTGQLDPSKSDRTVSVELNGNGFSLDLGNSTMTMRPSTETNLAKDSTTGKITGGSTLYVHDFAGITSTIQDATGSTGTSGAIFTDFNGNNQYGNWPNRGSWRAVFQDVTINSASAHLTSMARCEVTFAGNVTIQTANEPLIAGSVIFSENAHVNLISTKPNPILWMNNEQKDSSISTADSREVTLLAGAKVSLRNVPGTVAATSTAAGVSAADAGSYSAIAWAFGNVTVNQDAVLDLGTAAGGINWYQRPSSTPVVTATTTGGVTTGGFGNYIVNGGTINARSSLTKATTTEIIRNTNGATSAGATIAINPNGSFFVTGNMSGTTPVINWTTGNASLIMNQPKAFDIKNIGVNNPTDSNGQNSVMTLGDSTSGDTTLTHTRTFQINNSDISLWNNTSLLTTNADGAIITPPDYDAVEVGNFAATRSGTATTLANRSVVTSSEQALADAYKARTDKNGAVAFNRIMGVSATPQVFIQPWTDSTLPTSNLLTQLLNQANNDATKQNLITDADKAVRTRIQLGTLPSQVEPNYTTGDLTMAPIWANKNTKMTNITVDSLASDVENLKPADNSVGNNGFELVKTSDTDTPFQIATTNGGLGIQAVVSRGSRGLTDVSATGAAQTNVIDVTPPEPVQVTSHAATTISGTATADTSSVRLKILAAGESSWSDFSAPVTVTNNQWTIPVAGGLSQGDQIQIFATDNSGRTNDPLTYPTIDTVGRVGNENPAVTTSFHDATFPKATLYTISDSVYWGSQLDVIDFGTHDVVPKDQIFMADKDSLGSMSVVNDYNYAVDWTLTATLTVPLITDDAIKYRAATDGELVPINEESLLISAGTLAGKSSQQLSAGWNEDMTAPGIFMNLKASDSYVAGDQTGEIEWNLGFVPANDEAE
ncbi:hypothetical protein EQG49_07835 [Periweissella cryptocerci]|uniref:WxL domain-containing protein n=1 Tax=Periweissella cryptocerci TaxID=2506420 RepID=A0A4P6YUB8_9LACO|nr:pectate lyase-like adhesive domain-containing protein [Periweissella cryptocerci]QBO36379.1 hypothetical protein EQG49_07835 [Periweissella cryptocerci]